MKSYKDLDIYKEAFQVSVDIFNLTTKLSKHETYETGSQIRRSSQSIKDNIVEGYGRRRYKADFIKFLIYSHASLLEASSQADFLNTVHPKSGWEEIYKRLDVLGIKLSKFINYVEHNWNKK